MAAGASLLLAAAPARAAITYVGRVASTTVTAASTSTVLTAGRTVTAGDAIVVAVLLSSTSTTAAKVVDSAGNTYALDRDLNDGSAGDRVVVFSATNAKALPSGGTITITYPSSAECNASADEFTGIAALERAASAFATSTSFNSGASGTTSQASELIFGVVGNESGNAPVFAAGWTALPTLSIVDDRLTVAYQVASTTGSFTASGTISGTWMAAVLAYPASGSPPPPDQPPVAVLAVSQAASPPLTVNASAAGSTDTDSTPIASYSFDWGDGSNATVVNAPNQTASHTYSSAGTYTVTLIATDTANLGSTPVTKNITLTADAPPVAQLAVTPSGLTANASAAGSTDTDAWPIASYSFSWGDGSSATVVNAPNQTASHTYSSGGTYTVTLTAKDTGGLTSAPVTQSVTVSSTSTSPTAVYVGYYDTHHAVNTQPKPDPWQGSPNVVFIGTSDHNDNNWDSSCIRVDNLTSGTLSSVVVTADLGSSHFALWGTNSIPAGYHLILAQTTYQNFDGSDTNPAGCYGCNPNLCLTERSSDIPVVHVTVNSTTKDYLDKGQVMNTGGYDGAGCPYVGGSLPTTRYDESHAWAQVFTASGASIVAAPSAVTSTPPNHPRVLSLAAPWPNPARGVLALRFSLPAQGPAWLGLYDVSGRVVRTFVNNVMEAGDYDLRQDVSDVSPGVYFVRLVTPGATMHERLIVEP